MYDKLRTTFETQTSIILIVILQLMIRIIRIIMIIRIRIIFTSMAILKRQACLFFAARERNVPKPKYYVFLNLI